MWPQSSPPGSGRITPAILFQEIPGFGFFYSMDPAEDLQQLLFALLQQLIIRWIPFKIQIRPVSPDQLGHFDYLTGIFHQLAILLDALGFQPGKVLELVPSPRAAGILFWGQVRIHRVPLHVTQDLKGKRIVQEFIQLPVIDM